MSTRFFLQLMRANRYLHYPMQTKSDEDDMRIKLINKMKFTEIRTLPLSSFFVLTNRLGINP